MPGLFAAYHDLIAHIAAERLEDAETVIEEIASETWHCSSMRICDFRPESYSPQTFERYEKCLAVDPTTPIRLVPPTQ